MNTANVEKYLDDIAFSSSYNPPQVKVGNPNYHASVEKQKWYAEYRLRQAKRAVKKANERKWVVPQSMHDEKWAWEIFSQLVLPMVKFIDE